MKKRYRIHAKSVGLLEMEIEAEDYDDALNQLTDLLEDGAVPEVDGWIEDEEAELVEDEE